MKSYKDYMLFDKLPQTWCAGCSHGIVLQSIAACLLYTSDAADD